MHDDMQDDIQANITHARRNELPRFVVADDDKFVSSMLASQLEFKFECVGSAADAPEAIAVVGEQRPEVAILDVNMPGGGALAATRAIRATSPETAIVILSGDELHSEVLDLLKAGAITYMRKGISSIELARSLSAAMAAHRSASRALDVAVPDLA